MTTAQRIRREAFCRSCRYWDRFETKGYEGTGLCRRFPPAVNDGGLIRQPMTGHNAWCGEHADAEAMGQAQ